MFRDLASLPTRRTVIATLVIASAVLLAVAWWNRDRFALPPVLDPAIGEEPRQVRVDEPAFMASAESVDYRVQPLYEYELTGLVVSFRRFKPGIGLHARWNDYINIADVCVVWGTNVDGLDLNRFKFWNGEFTCNYSTRDAAAWGRFEPDQLSNNHLLTNDARLKKVIGKLRVGDQIHLRGRLAEYGQPGGPVRGTSTTRTDTGNGACETIYLSEFRILDSMDNGWRTAFWLAVGGLLAGLGLWFSTPHHQLRRY